MSDEDIASEVQGLHAGVCRMAGMVESRVEATILAWLDRQADLADSVRFADDEIDEAELDLEAWCMDIMVKIDANPACTRRLVAYLRIISGLERIADLARLISKRVMRVEKRERVTPPPVAKPMAETVRAMIADTIQSFRNDDTDLAQQVRRTDRSVDRYNRDVFRWSAEGVGEQPDLAETYLDVLILCRALERMGDIAANMAEDIIFAVEGDMVRHRPLGEA